MYMREYTYLLEIPSGRARAEREQTGQGVQVERGKGEGAHVLHPVEPIVRRIIGHIAAFHAQRRVTAARGRNEGRLESVQRDSSGRQPA